MNSLTLHGIIMDLKTMMMMMVMIPRLYVPYLMSEGKRGSYDR